MKAKRLWTIAIALCMVLWIMPVGVFATEETKDECICSTSCSEGDVNEDCEVCQKDFKQCIKAKQKTETSTQGEKKSTTTTEKASTTTEEPSAATTEKASTTTEEPSATTTEKSSVTTTEKASTTTAEKARTITEEPSTTTAEKARTITEEPSTTTAEKARTITEEPSATTTEEPSATTTEKSSATTTEKSSETTEQETEDTGININEISFPDKAFRTWIIKNISGADDEVLTSEEIEAVKSIDVSGQGIESLVGIEQFKNLESLDCSNNSLKTLDLTSLSALETLEATGQKATATAVEEESGWKIYMEKVVGEDNLKNIVFADDSLPEGAKYQYGVVSFSEESIPDTLTYSYKTGFDTAMEVTLTLDKKALPEPEPAYTITLDEKTFDFGKKCIGITPGKSSVEIENNSDESINFEVVSTSEKSNYDINIDKGTIEANSKKTIEIGPKEELGVGEYKENFSIKIKEEEVKTFSASFQVIEHDKSQTWSYDSQNHWYKCDNCETKVDMSAHEFVWKVDQQPTSSKAGYGHNECSICGYKEAATTIAASIDINEKNFPDVAFRNWIVKNIPGAEDYVLTVDEIKAVNSINISGQGIESLVGIKQFKNLETLNCSNNNLKTLDLTGMEALKTVNVTGQKATATVIEEKDGWKLYMKDVVGADNLKNIEFAANSLPEGAQYKDGVVIFASEPDIKSLTYTYKTGANKDMDVTLTLDKEALSELGQDFKITLNKDKFDFGKKCVGIVPTAQEFRIENKSSETVKFEVVSTSQNSNYTITTEGLKNGNLEAGDIVTVKIQPKSGLKVGTYNENFSIKVDGKEVETFSASFQVIDHNKKTTWSSDSDKHWHECTNCGTKFDEAAHSLVWKVDQQATAAKNGYGHYECSVCGYKKSSVIITVAGNSSSTTRTVSTVKTTTVSTVKTTTVSTVKTTTATSLLSKIIPTTGDDSHIVLWIGVLAICGVTILGALGRYLSKRK